MLKRMFKAIIAGREARAEEEIVRMLQATEFRGESTGYVTTLLRSGEIHKFL